MRPLGSRRPASLLLAGTSPAGAGSRAVAAVVDLLIVAASAAPLVLERVDLLSAGLVVALSAAATVAVVVTLVATWWATGRTPGAVAANLRWVDAYAGTVPGAWRLPGRGLTAVSLTARDPAKAVPAVGLDRLDFMPPARRDPPHPPRSLVPSADPLPPVVGPPPVPSAPLLAAPAVPLPPPVQPTRAQSAQPAPTPPPAPPVPSPRSSHVVLVAGEERVEIATTALLGRNPVAPAGMAVDEIVRVMDMSRSVSKTHAKLTWDGQVLSIEDQGSTNGTTVRRADGTHIPCPPGSAVLAMPGEGLHLGDKAYSVQTTASSESSASLEITSEGVR